MKGDGTPPAERRDQFWQAFGIDTSSMLDPGRCSHPRGIGSLVGSSLLSGPLAKGCPDCGWLAAWGAVG